MSDEGDSGDGSGDCPNPSELSNAKDQNKLIYNDIQRSNIPELSAKIGLSNSLNDHLNTFIEKEQYKEVKKDRRIKNGNWLNYRRRIKELRNRFRNCPNCGLPFNGARKNRIYCSTKCRQEKYLEGKDEALKNKIAEIMKKDEK